MAQRARNGFAATSAAAIIASAASLGCTVAADPGSAPGGGTPDSGQSQGTGGDDAGPGNPSGNEGGAGQSDGGPAPGADAGSGNGLPPLPTGPVDIKLGMPERQEWDTGVGYCGEASIQTVALHYGAWISQGLIRTIAGQPVVLGNGGESVLSSLHFRYEVWDYASATNPEFQAFMVWMKGYLARGIPTFFSEYVHDHGNPPDPDYDHLVPGIGIKTDMANSTTFEPTDVLYFNTNEQTSVALPFSQLVGDRTCTVDSYLGGCVPAQVDYGVAVTGIVDDNHATVPVEVSVPSDHEPDVTSGQTAVQMTAKVAVSNLVAGNHYTLLRYNDYKKVPTTGGPASFLSAPSDGIVPFTATGTQWTYGDPTPFSSDSAVYYRCVPN